MIRQNAAERTNIASTVGRVCIINTLINNDWVKMALLIFKPGAKNTKLCSFVI